ncbi:hypothetical protein MMC29_003720 [Sticta canariensis]|nr:hypothetical protein [Sticta canariensis]
MSFYNQFEPQFQAHQAVNWAGSTNWVENPLFAAEPWDSDFFHDLPISLPAETAEPVHQHHPAYFSTDPPPVTPDPFPTTLPSTHWQHQDESQILPAADIQALCRAIGCDIPDFAAMPPAPFPLEPATSDPAGVTPAHTENFAPASFDPAGSTPVVRVPALNDNFDPAGLNRAGSTPAALSPTGFVPAPSHIAPIANPAPHPVEPQSTEPQSTEPVPAALNRRRKAQRQLKAIQEGTEVPVNYKRGRKALPLGAPKAKYTKRVPARPSPA